MSRKHEQTFLTIVAADNRRIEMRDTQHLADGGVYVEISHAGDSSKFVNVIFNKEEMMKITQFLLQACKDQNE